MKLVLTCEHGGNTIPDKYKKYFKHSKSLQTHLGYDLGALDVFKTLEPLSEASFYSTTSRLLIELNRSLFHKQLFSEATKDLPKADKIQILKLHYFPFRKKVEQKIKEFINANNSVLHLSIHSFTPILNGDLRRCDIGLLYDSRKKLEKAYCKNIKAKLLQENPSLNIRLNYPYLGRADGFTTFLRKQFPTHYIGIEIEVNQKFTTHNLTNPELKQHLFAAIASTKN